MTSSIHSALTTATRPASQPAPASRHVAPRRNSFQELFEGTRTQAAASQPAPASRQVAARRNSFQELFGGTGAQLAAPQTRTPFSPPGIVLHAATHLPDGSPALEHTRSAVTEAPGPPANTTSNDRTSAGVPSVPGMDLSMYTPLTPPVSLQPLMDALQRAGLSPGRFQFTELQSFEAFPTRPDLSYTNRQILIQGPHGAGLFDLYWALRTPWVTAVELRSDGIA